MWFSVFKENVSKLQFKVTDLQTFIIENNFEMQYRLKQL